MRLPSLIALSLLISGCASSPDTKNPPTSVSLCRNLDAGLPFWQTSCDLHFHKRCFVFMCHGATYNGVWMCYPDNQNHYPIPVRFVVGLIRSQIPKDMPLVLICCNDDGNLLHGFPNTYYAHDSVWSKPGPEMRYQFTGWQYGVSHADEFTEAK